MNELEARRRLLADPRRLPGSLQARVDADPRLAALREELIRTDDEMHALLARDEVPDGLADRIVLRARYRERSRWGLALAAAIVSVAIAVPAYLVTQGPALEREMLAHVAQGADELGDNSGIEPAVLRRSLAELGIEVQDAGYRIRHLANCVVAGRQGRHFTVDGPHGVISFVVLPGTSSAAPVLLQDGTTRGLFMKRAGLTIGVFAQHGADRGELEGMLRQVFA